MDGNACYSRTHTDFFSPISAVNPAFWDPAGIFGPICPASLEPPETDSHQPSTADLGRFDTDARASVAFRHSGWTHARTLIWTALHRPKQPDSSRREYAECGSHAYVLRSLDDPSCFRIAGSACHDRFCLPCANERAHAIALNIVDACDSRQTRFLTLTLKSGVESLAELLDKLYACFQALRRRAFWKKRVTGGVCFLEVTWSEQRQRWHPHFHLLIEGKYLPHEQLKRHWFELTGNSTIVDIRLVRDTSHAIRYVTKYASKPFNNTYVNRPARLDEAIIALKGRKLVLTFGTWRGVLLARTPTEGAWEHVASLERVISLAALGDVDCVAILQSLTGQDLPSLYAHATPIPPEPPPPRPPDDQLTWFGTWRADGTYAHYGI